MFPANLNHRLALVLLTQNPQNLGFTKATFFHEQLKIEEVKSYYFSLFLIGSLSGGKLTLPCQLIQFLLGFSIKR